MSAATKKTKPLSHTLIAGGAAGFIESSICHPLDTIKTRMQLRNNHIESVHTRIKHSLIEPAFLHVRNSLVEPALRFKHSLSEPSTTVVAATLRHKHSFVEPANIIKLRQHSHAEPLLMQSKGMDAPGSSLRKNRTDVLACSKPSTGQRGDKIVGLKLRNSITTGNSITSAICDPQKLKLPSSTSVSTEGVSAAKCWWNQPKQNHVKTVTAETSNIPFRAKKSVSNIPPSKRKMISSNGSSTKNAKAWWNWNRNSSATHAGRGQSSKSAAWSQPMNNLNARSYGNQFGLRGHVTLSKTYSKKNIYQGPLGPIETARKIIRKEGFQSLYKGLSAVYVGIIPKMAIRFVSFEHYGDMIRKNTQLGERSINFTAGLASGLTEAVLIVTPAEVCKIRMQSQRHSLLDPVGANSQRYGNVVQTAITITREEGYCALYKGLVPTMLRQGCNQAVNFTVYNSMKTYWLEQQQQENFQTRVFGRHENPNQLPAMISMLIGGLSGAMGPIVNNPLDVVKTRLQKQNTTKHAISPPKYTGLLQACFIIAKEEGAGALWKGITPRLMRIVPGQAITFTAYEAICRWL